MPSDLYTKVRLLVAARGTTLTQLTCNLYEAAVKDLGTELAQVGVVQGAASPEEVAS